METAATVDKETLLKGTQVTAAQAEIQHNARARVTKDQQRSGIRTVKLSREVVGNLAGYRYSVMDLGQDSPVLSLQFS